MDAGPRSVIVVLVGLVLGAGTALTAAYLWAGDRTDEQRESIAAHRTRLERSFIPPADGLPLVAWIGDSTMLFSVAPGYPRSAAVELYNRGYSVQHRHVILPGSDPFHFYYVMGRVLRLDPDLVVIGTSLRLFSETSLGAPRNDLCSEIPIAEIPRAAALPLAVRGVTIPRLLLCPMLKIPVVGDLAFRLEGLRGVLQTVLGFGRSDKRMKNEAERFRFDRRTVANLSPDHACVVMLLASLDMARRNGTKVMVVISPVNGEELGSEGFDPDVYDDRVAMLRKLVRSHGATLVDLHAAVPTDGFFDPWGHLNQRGIATVAERMAEEIAQLDVLSAGSGLP